MTWGPEEACAAVGAQFASEPGPCQDFVLKAHALDQTMLYTVAIYGAIPTGGAMDEMPQPGGSWLVGPDGKVFAISSNPEVHDRHLCVRLINEIYRDGLQQAVDPETVMEQLHTLTIEREALTGRFRQAIRAGLGTKKRGLPLP